MATHLPQRELRNNPGAVLARVARGEELTITVRGQPVADLVPTRERVARPVVGWAQFAAGLSGMLADDERFDADVREGLIGDADDPFQRWT
jgi:prevent-host-death family protein